MIHSPVVDLPRGTSATKGLLVEIYSLHFKKISKVGIYIFRDSFNIWYRSYLRYRTLTPQYVNVHSQKPINVKATPYKDFLGRCIFA